MQKPKLIRITTTPKSLKFLLQGQLRFMSNYFDVLAIAGEGKELQEVAEIESVKVKEVALTRTISPVKDLKSVYTLYKIFKKEKPLLVHTHTPKAGISGMLAAYLARVPYRFHTVAGLPLLVNTGFKRKVLHFVEKLTYKCATHVFPNSRGLSEILVAEKLAKENKLKVIGKGSSNGIDTSFFDPAQVTIQEKNDIKKSLNINEDDFVFLFIGRVVKDKGINELINAFKKISIKNLNCKLILVGSFERELDPISQETEEEIENNDRIFAMGYQSNVRAYYDLADLLVFPSYREGFPNVVMQAGAMGLNSIVTNINGCNEIIQDGINGFIIPVKSEEKLLEKMQWLLDHQDENRLMASKARTSIKQNYERKYIWGEILKEYNSIIK